MDSSTRKLNAGEIGQLPDDAILLHHDETQRVYLLLQRCVVLTHIVEAVAELDDLLAHRDVGSAGGTRGAGQRECERAGYSAHRRSSSFDDDCNQQRDDVSRVEAMTIARPNDRMLHSALTEGNVRHGTTLPELMLVLAIVGILGGVALGRAGALRDRMSVRSAASETMATFALARRWSLSRASRTAITIDTTQAAVTVRSYTDTIAVRRLGASHGVAVSASRDSMAYAPNGLGYGASNLTIVLRRGASAETIYVSRLGRVRR